MFGLATTRFPAPGLDLIAQLSRTLAKPSSVKLETEITLKLGYWLFVCLVIVTLFLITANFKLNQARPDQARPNKNIIGNAWLDHTRPDQFKARSECPLYFEYWYLYFKSLQGLDHARIGFTRPRIGVDVAYA